MKSGLYHLPLLSSVDFGIVRSPGPGLGNLLFPISRALIGHARHGGDFIYPTMRQFKIGTFLRRERDKRTYGDVLRSRDPGEWRLWLKAVGLPSVAESEFNGSPVGVVVYSGLGRFFFDLAGERQLIGDWLSKNIQRQICPRDYDIAIHIRLGDFANHSAHLTGQSVRLPMDWYRKAYGEATALIGKRKPRVVLFTDEDPVRVRDMLGLIGIDIDDCANAINSIIYMSKARCVITSRSTFSMWGVFLGDQIAIWDARFDLASAFPVRPDLDLFV